MSLKIFISYSHQDEELKDQFLEHLSSLKNSGKISEWNDRKITPGDKWKNEIDENLKDSDIVVFLISSAFMSSNYCVNIEAKTAIEMHSEEQAVLIPVVVRAADWEDSELSKFQALPKDAKPISSWEVRDEGWLDVVRGIKKILEEFAFRPKTSLLVESESKNKSPLTIEMVDWLEDTEIKLTHRKVGEVNLSDIYTVPDVEIYSDKDDFIDRYKSACELTETHDKLLIIGEEQQGKTSLLKFYYREFVGRGFFPLYINGGSIKNACPIKLLTREIERQYRDLNYEQYIEKQNKLLLIDNIDQIKLNEKFRNEFFEAITVCFEKCVFSLQQSFSILVEEIPSLDVFTRAEIKGLGHKKREETITKWIKLGVEQSISDEEVYRRCDQLADIINSVVRVNIMPAKPIYIITLLQMVEANAGLNLELSSQGHCYQHLIYQSFKSVKIADHEYELYLNFLTEFAWWIFVNQTNPDSLQLQHFFIEYKKLYLISDSSRVVENLKRNFILQEDEDGLRVGFKYPYIYYFFVGKKISDSYLTDFEVQERAHQLIENLYREDYANILMFVNHHSKDAWVLERLNTELGKLFISNQPAALSKDQLQFMDDFMKQIPELVLEEKKVHEERDRYNDNLDVRERAEASQDKELEKDDESDVLSNINKTFKSMEIAGQIIRNRYASLRRDSLTSLAQNGIESGLRFLDYFLSESDVFKKEIIKTISSHLSENPQLPDKETERLAENAYLQLMYWVINGVVRKIATSVGSRAMS